MPAPNINWALPIANLPAQFDRMSSLANARKWDEACALADELIASLRAFKIAADASGMEQRQLQIAQRAAQQQESPVNDISQ